jgi:hypothetical protein
VSEYKTALEKWLAGTDASGERAGVPNSVANSALMSGRIGFVRRDAAYSEALDRVRDWTRAHFALADDVTILVSEIACAVPGCPPLETVVAFWTAADRRHHFKVFKPVAEVVRDDLPPAWLKDALVVPPGGDCDCC